MHRGILYRNQAIRRHEPFALCHFSSACRPADAPRSAPPARWRPVARGRSDDRSGHPVLRSPTGPASDRPDVPPAGARRPRYRFLHAVRIVDPAAAPWRSGGPRFHEGLPQGTGVRARLSCFSRSTRTMRPYPRPDTWRPGGIPCDLRSRKPLQGLARASRFASKPWTAPLGVVSGPLSTSMRNAGERRSQSGGGRAASRLRWREVMWRDACRLSGRADSWRQNLPVTPTLTP